MITGHFGFAFVARGIKRDASLTLLLIAAILPDLLDLFYAAIRLCSPAGLYSHSLPVLLPLAALAFVVGWGVSRRAGVGLAMAAVVLVHLAGDFVTGDKYLWPGGPVVGLGLYRFPLVDFIIEVPIAVGAWIFLRRTPGAPRWAASVWTVLAFIAIQGYFDRAKTAGSAAKPTGCVAGTVMPTSRG